MAGLPSLRKSLYAPLTSVIARRVPSRKFSTSYSDKKTDSCGLPIQPTWSVNDLLTSYPSPKLSPNTIARLYELSALVCPPQDAPQFDAVKVELEEMIRLVEAVGLVDTLGTIVKGRGEKEDADQDRSYLEQPFDTGSALLKYASRTQDGYYMVDAERKR